METNDEKLEGRIRDAAGWVIKNGILGKIVSSRW